MSPILDNVCFIEESTQLFRNAFDALNIFYYYVYFLKSYLVQCYGHPCSMIQLSTSWLQHIRAVRNVNVSYGQPFAFAHWNMEASTRSTILGALICSRPFEADEMTTVSCSGASFFIHPLSTIGSMGVPIFSCSPTRTSIPFTLRHWRQERCPSKAAAEQVYLSQLYPFSLAHLRITRWSPPPA